MNVGSYILSTGSLPIACGRISHTGSKGLSARDNVQTDTQDISPAAAQKTKADKKPAFHITNTDDDKVKPKNDTAQQTTEDTNCEDVQTVPAEKQEENPNTPAANTGSETTAASVIAYMVSAGANDLKPAEPAPASTVVVEELTNVSQTTSQPALKSIANLPNLPTLQNLPNIPNPQNLPTLQNTLKADSAQANNSPAVQQNVLPAIQNDNIETTDNPKQTSEDDKSQVIQSAIGGQQATGTPALQETEGTKETKVQQIENQVTQTTTSANKQETTTIPNLQAAVETAYANYANQSGELPNKVQPEQAAGKTSQSKTKIHQGNSLHQQTDAQTSSSSTLNKTQTLQPEGQKNPPLADKANSKDSSGNESAFSGLNNNSQVQSDQKILAAEQTSKDSQNTRLATDLSGQVQESAKALLQSNKSEVTIRLNPPELGSVCLKVSDNGNQISGVLQVSRPETRHEIQQMLPDIIRNLEDAGISIKRFDVVLNNPSDQPAFGGQQQSLYQQNNQQSYNPGSGTGYQSVNYLFNDAGQYQKAGAVQGASAGASSLNILM
jgi:flagellar hook-length control protein FliK